MLDSTFSLLRLSLLRGNSPPTCVSPRLTTTHRFDQQRQNSESPSGPSATDKTLIGAGERGHSLHNPLHPGRSISTAHNDEFRFMTTTRYRPKPHTA